MFESVSEAKLIISRVQDFSFMFFSFNANRVKDFGFAWLLMFLTLSPPSTKNITPLLERAKWLAVFAMIVDHVGCILFPEFLFLRWIGRLSFPLFCFVIAQRLVEKPQRLKGYMARFLIWGIISQYFYGQAFFSNYLGFVDTASLHAKGPAFLLNIFFTLFQGLFVLVIVQELSKLPTFRRFFLGLGLLLPMLALGYWMDYGIIGVVMIPMIVFAARCSFDVSIHVTVVMAIGINFYIVLHMLAQSLLYIMMPLSCLMLYPAFALIAKFGNKPMVRMPGLFFYAFYPLHLYIIAWIRDLVMENFFR